MWVITNCGKDGNTTPPYLPPEKPSCRQEATVRTRHGTTNWFQIGKGVRQGCILSPAYLNYMQNTSREMLHWVEAQAGIKIAGRNINNLRFADDTTIMAESKEELKSLLMKVKKKSENIGLKLNIQKMKIMAPGPIISWQIDGETLETVHILFSWTPKSLLMVTADVKLKNTCSLEEKL